tara:strand:- start:219 stop:434 length:216 start_codon:yes stop_codon:yes gene_type:complete
MRFGLLLITIMIVSLYANISNANPVVEWLTNEKNKIVEYQTKSWADTRIQFADNKQSILNFFKRNQNEPQD